MRRRHRRFRRRRRHPKSIRFVNTEEFQKLSSELKAKRKILIKRNRKILLIIISFMLLLMVTIFLIASTTGANQTLNLQEIAESYNSKILLSIVLLIVGIIIFLKARE